MPTTGTGLMSSIGKVVARLALVLTLLGALASVAAAQDIDPIVKKGTDLRRQGRDREALAEFQRAAQVNETPRVTAQIALAEQALGLWEDSWAHLKKALDHEGDPWIQKNHAVLQTALGVIEEHVGIVEIWGTPDGAEVLLDSRPIGRLPSAQPVAVTSDQASLVVRSAGYIDVTRTLKVKIGALVREHVELHPAPPPVAQIDMTVKSRAADGAANGPGLIAIAGPSETSGPEAASGKRPIYSRWWFWTAVGVVALGAGAALLLSNRSSVSGDTCSDPTQCTSTWK
jgi:hypothetical protein